MSILWDEVILLKFVGLWAFKIYIKGWEEREVIVWSIDNKKKGNIVNKRKKVGTIKRKKVGTDEFALPLPWI